MRKQRKSRLVFRASGPDERSRPPMGRPLPIVATSSLFSSRSTMVLPFDGAPRGARRYTDRVRDRFGSVAVTRAVLLGPGQGPTCPSCRTEEE